MKRYLLLLLLFQLSLICSASEILSKKIAIVDTPNTWMHDFNTAFCCGKSELKNTVLYQDEEGQTHYTNIERIGNGVIAKKQFFLKNSVCEKAQLFAFHASGLELFCNGKELKTGKTLTSTGWYVWDIPPGLLRKGLNEFVFSGKGTLVIEPSLFPNRSARSLNNGQEWNFDNLGVNNGDGEYLVRLRLQPHPEKGIITSNVYDLLYAADTRNIHGVFTSAENLRLVCRGNIPSGTSISFEYRSGTSLLYSPDKWSKWNNLKKVGKTWIIDTSLKNRFLQIRAVLTTVYPEKTPFIEQISISGDVRFSDVPENLKVVYFDRHDIVATSIPFTYQEPTYRTKALREKYNLDDVIKDGNTEFEKFVLLRNWARHTAVKGWDWGTGMWCPPWDALIILATNKQPSALCMCTHYSTIFTQCAISLGFTARQVILDHHCVAEIWSDQFNKWILMDTGNSQNPEMNCHLEHNGIPLNALEIRTLWKTGKGDEIKFVYANQSGITQKERDDFESSYLKNFRRFAIPLRNNFLGNPFPGELEQGMSNYYCDRYLWWEDTQEPVESPEYGKTSNRAGDFYWTLNKTFIDLVCQEKDLISVSLCNNAPAFSHYLISVDGGKWTRSTENFQWKIHSGVNELQVKAVNFFGLECPVSKAIIEKAF